MEHKLQFVRARLKSGLRAPRRTNLSLRSSRLKSGLHERWRTHFSVLKVDLPMLRSVQGSLGSEHKMEIKLQFVSMLPDTTVGTRKRGLRELLKIIFSASSSGIGRCKNLLPSPLVQACPRQSLCLLRLRLRDPDQLSGRPIL